MSRCVCCVFVTHPFRMALEKILLAPVLIFILVFINDIKPFASIQRRVLSW